MLGELRDKTPWHALRSQSDEQGSFTGAAKQLEVGRARLPHQTCIVHARFFRRQKGALEMNA